MNTPGNADWMPDFEDPPKENWRMSSVCREPRAELDRERALADRLAKGCDALLTGYDTSSWDSPMDDADVRDCENALAAWKAARDEADH